MAGFSHGRSCRALNVSIRDGIGRSGTARCGTAGRDATPGQRPVMRTRNTVALRGQEPAGCDDGHANPEPVNPGETPASGVQARGTSFGGLIQTSAGTGLGTGSPRTKRSGWTA